jgi:hypothetical protein
MSDSDEVILSFPRKSQYYSVARLVVGGLATPLQMSYDALDDLQQAISSLLDNEALPGDDEFTLKLRVGADHMDATLGCFPANSVEVALSNSSDGDSALGLRRVLDTIVDEFQVTPDGNGGEWVRLTKRVGAPV